MIGLYALVFCLFLIPLCSMWHMDIVAVRCSSVTSHMWLIIRQILFGSVSFQPGFEYWVISHNRYISAWLVGKGKCQIYFDSDTASGYWMDRNRNAVCTYIFIYV